ncbi:MAG: translation initiation factor [Kofleriaceae bacterium]
MTKPSGNHPFAKLQALRTPEPEGAPPPAPAVEEPAPPAPAGPKRRTPADKAAAATVVLGDASGKGPAWAVVRLERKGRGGKEATIVEKLGLGPAELAVWCKELKQALGCGGVVEGDALVLQGDLRGRLPAALTKRGVRKVTVSG